MAAPVKSATPEQATSAERSVPREAYPVSRDPGFGVSMADPVDRLQGAAGNRAVNAFISRHRPLVSAGQALPRRLRGEMEARFGEDFSLVRVHSGASAGEGAAALQAKAYTFGQDIVFADRAYAPETFEGRRLLAHELAHVVQQRRGGAAPEFRRGTALEQAAEQAARSIVYGSAPVAVGGSSGIGIAREGSGEDEIAKATAAWTHFDRETEEEARRKPGPSPTRAASANPPATTDPPATSSGIDPALKKKSQDLRNRRKDLLDRREEARKQGKDPAKVKATRLRRGLKVGEYHDAVRAGTRQAAQAEADRHAAVVRGQSPMTHEDMYNKTLAMRGFPAGAGVWERQHLQGEYGELKEKLDKNPQTAVVLGLESDNQKLKREIAKLDRGQHKQGGLATEDKERLDKLKATLEANEKKIQNSEVTAMRGRANSLHDKLAISGLRDPDAPKDATGQAVASKGAHAGWDQNTHAVVQVVDKNGKIIAWGAGSRDEHGHAEQNALVQIRQQVKSMKGGLPPGTRMEVVGDQVVCPEV